jgi:hypothetical protein
MSTVNLYKDNLKQSVFFNSSKEKTNDFFKDSKVGSCSHVFVKNGVALAAPFKITNQKDKPLNNYKNCPLRSSELKSVYRGDYDIRYDMHAGMNNKPLSKYDPDSYRNRLATGGIVMPHKNMSLVEIGDRRYYFILIIIIYL